MPMNHRLLRPLARLISGLPLADDISLWFAEMFPTYWHWSE